jgi:hypothetical protein
MLRFVAVSFSPLKVLCNEKGGGARKVANISNRSRTVAINVLLSSSFVVVLCSIYFRFRQEKKNNRRCPHGQGKRSESFTVFTHLNNYLFAAILREIEMARKM